MISRIAISVSLSYFDFLASSLRMPIASIRGLEVQVLRRAATALPEMARLAGVFVRGVQRVEAQGVVSDVANGVGSAAGSVGRGRLSGSEPFVVEVLAQESDR